MLEHTQLKEICEKIGHKLPSYIYYNTVTNEFTFKGDDSFTDERDIIFTTEFIKKLREFLASNKCPMGDMYMSHNVQRSKINHLLNNLDNPSSYIYNLICFNS